MFSQYSWWDFIKFCLALAIPYYAYVIWTYYREDIREWISNRGHSESGSPVQEAEEETPPSFFRVNDYSAGNDAQPVASQQPAQSLPSSSPSSAPAQQQQLSQQNAPQEHHEEVELQGPQVADQPEEIFGLPVLMQAENSAEQSIDAIISAAGRVSVDQEGFVSPLDADDVPAAKIAAVINNQQGRSAFSDFTFAR